MSSKSQPNSVKLYLDRNLGSKVIPAMLAEQKIPFEIHDNHLSIDAPDEDWIILCSSRNWIGISKDLKLKYNPIIKSAIKSSKVGIFTITARNLTGAQYGELLLKFHKKIINFYLNSRKPFLATLSANGHISKIKL